MTNLRIQSQWRFNSLKWYPKSKFLWFQIILNTIFKRQRSQISSLLRVAFFSLCPSLTLTNWFGARKPVLHYGLGYSKVCAGCVQLYSVHCTVNSVHISCIQNWTETREPLRVWKSYCKAKKPHVFTFMSKWKLKEIYEGNKFKSTKIVFAIL